MASMEKFIFKQMNMGVEPSINEKVKRKPFNYYQYLIKLCRENGFTDKRIHGFFRVETLEKFLESINVQFEKKIVINHIRQTYNQYLRIPPARIDYFQLLYQAKLLGYKQDNRGRPSTIKLETYLEKVK